MVVATAETHRGFSDWLSEESLYILQRIERWATITRGYNRLRSTRLSSKRYSHHEDLPDTSGNNIHALKRLHRRSSDETGRINCCGTFNYQSNSHLDSTCLESYRYDHSIYFKTIGDIRSSKSKESLAQSANQLELDVSAFSKRSQNDNPQVVTPNGDVRWDYLIDGDDPELEKILRNVWPIVDLSKLTDNESSKQSSNINFDSQCSETPSQKSQEPSLMRAMSFRKSRRSSKTMRLPTVSGDNNVSWPGVLLSFNNMEPALTSHQRALNVK